MRLAKGWIHHPKNGAGAGPSADRGGGVFMGASMRGAGRESVFMRDAREVGGCDAMKLMTVK